MVKQNIIAVTIQCTSIINRHYRSAARTAMAIAPMLKLDC